MNSSTHPPVTMACSIPSMGGPDPSIEVAVHGAAEPVSEAATMTPSSARRERESILVSHAGFHRAPPQITLLTAQHQDVVGRPTSRSGAGPRSARSATRRGPAPGRPEKILRVPRPTEGRLRTDYASSAERLRPDRGRSRWDPRPPNAPQLGADHRGLIPSDRCQVAAHPLHRLGDSSGVRDGVDALGGHVADELSADRVVAVGVQSHDAVVGDFRFEYSAIAELTECFQGSWQRTQQSLSRRRKYRTALARL